MRVLETEATQLYNMGKNRKHKMRKAKEASESSDDGCASVPVCNHINMAVNFASMKKGLAKQVFGECASCSKESSSGRKSGQGETTDQASASHIEESLLGDLEPTLWVCLQCGHQGCDRNSRDKHGLKHYETPRSSCHCLVINSSTWTCWCYKCDDDIPLERSRRLQECMEFLRKQAGLPQPEPVKRVSHEASATVDGAEQVKDTNTRPLTPKSSTPGLCNKIKGLSNLGNTCFFNAVLQNVTQTHCFESCLLERGKKGRSLSISGKSDTDDSSTGEESDGEPPPVKELPYIAVSLGEAGPLTQSLIHFLMEMNNNSSNRSSTVNPNALFTQVCKKAQRFRGYHQQDSHELLRYLLDNMKMEEVKRRQAAILKFFKLPENVNPKKVDEETRYRVREYGRQGKHTFVDSVFGGNLISTVICEECSFISQIFEPFLDISIPITEEKPQRPNQVPGGRKKEAVDVETVEESPAIGIDGFALKGDKNSRHVSKKEKRQAKKDAKRRAKVSKNQVLPMAGENTPSVEEGDGQGEEAESTETQPSKDGEGQKEALDEEGNSSNRDDPSDADVEDNLESDVNRFASLSASFGEKQVTEEEQGAVGGNENTETFPSVMQDSCGAGSLSESSGTFKGAESSTGPGSLSGSTSTIKQGQDSPEEGPDQARPSNGHLCNGEEAGHCNDHKDESQCDNRTEGQNGVCQISDINGETENRNGVCQVSDINGEGKKRDVEGKLSASLCNGELENRTYNSCDVEIVKKSLSDTHIVNGHASSCGMPQCSMNKEENNLCNGISTDSSVLADKLDKLQLQDGEDTTDNTTSKYDHLPKSRSAECVGPTLEGGRNSPKPFNSSSILDSVNKKTSPALCRQTSNHSKRKEAKFKSTLTLGQRYQPSSRECSIMSCLHQFTSAELLTGNNRFGCAQCTKIKSKHNPNKEKKEKQYSIASKQYLIFTPPPILTLHLKRFEQVGYSSRKVNRHVDFPFVLDLAPYCSSLCQGIKPGQQKILYALYGVVEHSGRLNAGHYTAYVKVRPNVGLTNTFLASGFPSKREYIQRYLENLASNVSLEREESIDVLEEKLVPPGRWYHISDSRVSEATESTVQRAQAYLLFYERIY